MTAAVRRAVAPTVTAVTVLTWGHVPGPFWWRVIGGALSAGVSTWLILKAISHLGSRTDPPPPHPVAGLRNVHDPARCEGQGCSIHHPSDHHMASWPKVWRPWHGYFERTCPHGIGHPDPDDMAYLQTRNTGDDLVGVHGCDGCCVPPGGEP